MRSPLPFPCVPDRPYKILLVQVGTLSFSHPSLGVSLFISFGKRIFEPRKGGAVTDKHISFSVPVLVPVRASPEERKKENTQPKGGMGERHAATTQGF